MGAVDDYLATLEPTARAAFEHIVGVAAAAAPDAVQGTTYGMAALLLDGKGLLAIRAATRHLSIFPCSGRVVDAARDLLEGCELAKGTIRFTADHPPSDAAVRDIVRLRRAEIER